MRGGGACGRATGHDGRSLAADHRLSVSCLQRLAVDVFLAGAEGLRCRADRGLPVHPFPVGLLARGEGGVSGREGGGVCLLKRAEVRRVGAAGGNEGVLLHVGHHVLHRPGPVTHHRQV